MPWIPRKTFHEWPSDAVDLPREEIQRLYESGFAGASHNAEASEAFAAMFPNSAEDIAHQFGLAGNGAGKLVAPFVHILEMFPGCAPGPAQVVGDCFPAGTMVRMVDGSEKPIELVAKGETVLSPTRKPRKVIDFIAKDFAGHLVEVKGEVRATPDHQFWGSDGKNHEWVPVGSHQGQLACKNGKPISIGQVKRRGFAGKVFCIGVENDHSFLANGYAVHNCVSHSEKNAALLTMVTDIVSEQPDEKTGIYEGVPDVPPEGIANGVLSTEAFYWHRGYSGHGWFCSAAAKVAVEKSGFVLRKNYPDLGFDLTQYSNRNIALYGSKAPGENVLKVTRQNLIHDMAEASTVEAIRDFLANGYGISSCGSEGFSNKRDQYGLSEKTTSWAHAMAYWAVDDRDVIKQLVGEPLVLVMNSWNIWNSGPRDIYQSAGLVPADKKELWTRLGIVNSATGNIMIPEGSFWAKWSRVKSREVFVHSGGVGFPRKKLPDLGTFIWG
jgi:hypothetical protein